MKIKYTVIYLAAALLAATSCSKEEGNSDNGQLLLAPALPNMSKATETEFESGDRFGIYAVEYKEDAPLPLQLSGNWANNSMALYNGTNWSISPVIWWNNASKLDVIAYYPYNSNPNSVDNYLFTIEEDQRESGFTLSDLMWAKAKGAERSAGAVALNFRHKLSRLDIKLIRGDDFEGDIPADALVRVMGTVSSAIMDMESGGIEKNPQGKEMTITAHQRGVGEYSAIIVPQKILNQIPLVEILVNNVSYLVSSRFIFEEGVRHTLNITLNSDPNKILITIGGGIEDWN
ncbi:MAG: fimbrillin family protein [Candidatus Egerieousia sp.]